MKPARFEYARPESIKDALRLLDQHGSDAAILSGGQSLVPMMNLRMAMPSIVIDINRIPRLDGISIGATALSIGARARHNDVLRSPMVISSAPLLTQALRNVAHEAIRNRGTLGGSLALADPAAELPACMVCLGAEIIVESLDGSRSITAADFFQGIYATALEPNELITRVEVPLRGADWSFRFNEAVRRHGDFAIAALALGIQHKGGRILQCRIVFSGVEDAPRRLTAVEDTLVNTALNDPESAGRAADLLEEQFECTEGGEYPPNYRLHVARQLLLGLLKDFPGVVRHDCL